MYFYYTNIIITVIDSFTVITLNNNTIIVGGERSLRGEKGENCGHFKFEDTVYYNPSWIFMRYISRVKYMRCSVKPPPTKIC